MRTLRLKTVTVDYIDNVLPHTEFSNRTQFIQYACDQYWKTLQESKTIK